MKKIKDIIKQCDFLYFSYLKLVEKKYEKSYKKAKKKGRELELIKKNYKSKTGKTLSEPPISYTEKIQFSKLFSNSDIKTKLSDKFLVREWVSEKIGNKYLIPLLGSWDNFDDIDFSNLPDKFVLKTNHASGTNVIVKDKSKINYKNIRKKFNFWLKQNFAFAGKGYELHYSKIVPKIICEKYMTDKSDRLNDFKFLCFDGIPYYCWVDVDRMGNHKRNVYDMNWNLQNWNQFNYSNCDYEITKPDNFDEMIKIVKVLAEGFPQVRVDLYNVDGNIYFGEMTFTNGKGYELIYPEAQDIKLGNLWKEDFK